MERHFSDIDFDQDLLWRERRHRKLYTTLAGAGISICAALWLLHTTANASASLLVAFAVLSWFTLLFGMTLLRYFCYRRVTSAPWRSIALRFVATLRVTPGTEAARAAWIQLVLLPLIAVGVIWLVNGASLPMALCIPAIVLRAPLELGFPPFALVLSKSDEGRWAPLLERMVFASLPLRTVTLVDARVRKRRLVSPLCDLRLRRNEPWLEHVETLMRTTPFVVLSVVDHSVHLENELMRCLEGSARGRLIYMTDEFHGRDLIVGTVQRHPNLRPRFGRCPAYPPHDAAAVLDIASRCSREFRYYMESRDLQDSTREGRGEQKGSNERLARRTVRDVVEDDIRKILGIVINRNLRRIYDKPDHATRRGDAARVREVDESP